MNTSVPKEAVAIYNKALEFSSKGELEKSLALYEEAVKTHPDFLEAYSNMGELHSRLNRRQAAIESYQKALSIDRNFRVLLNIGVEFYNIMDLDRALEYFLESLKLQPEFIEGNYYTGLIYFNKKEYKKAEPYLATVKKKDNKHLKANYLLSYLYYEWKDYRKTITCLDSIKETANDAHFINRYYGFCYYYLGDYEKAVSFLQEAIIARPEYARFKKYLEGLTYENKVKEVGDVNKAIKELEMEMDKKNPGLSDVTRLSMLYIFQGENQKAEKLLIKTKDKMAS